VVTFISIAANNNKLTINVNNYSIGIGWRIKKHLFLQNIYTTLILLLQKQGGYAQGNAWRQGDSGIKCPNEEWHSTSKKGGARAPSLARELDAKAWGSHCQKFI